MKQKLAIARALVHDPEILFMDEPTANLDPESAKTVREFILELKKQKKTIFLNTHNLDEAQRICDRIGILNTRLMAVGTPEELERSIHGRKTVIQLRQVNNAILDSLKKLQLKNLVREGNKLTFDVVNPKEENPDMVDAIVAAGGRVETVTVTSSSLEDAYLKLVKENASMTAWMPWKIARKELKVISRKRSIIFYTVGLPLLVAVAFSLVVKNQIALESLIHYRLVPNQSFTSSLF